MDDPYIDDTVLYFFGTLVLTVLVCSHGMRFYQDFCTKDRKSVQHRRKPPKTTQKYTYAQVFTSLSCLFYLFTYFATSINFSLAKTIGLCQGASVAVWTGVHLSKIFMYFVFLIRLEMVYGDSYHGYQQRTLVIIAVILSTVAAVLIIFEYIVYTSPIWGLPRELYRLDEGSFPFTCIEIVNAYSLGIIFTYLLFDLIMNIIYCMLFMIPLRNTLKSIAGSQRNLEENKKLSQKMLAVAYKVCILTSTLCVSSIVSTLIFFAANGFVGFFVADGIINVLCLMLMTPYYDDEIWYKRLCCLCIRCCDVNGYSTNKQETKEKLAQGASPESSAGKSRDTMDAVLNIGDKQAASEEQNLKVIQKQ